MDILFVQVWLFQQRPESLSPLTKYMSATTGLGNNYIIHQKVNVVSLLPLKMLAARLVQPALRS